MVNFEWERYRVPRTGYWSTAPVFSVLYVKRRRQPLHNTAVSGYKTPRKSKGVRERFKRVIVHKGNICNILDMCRCVMHGMYSTTTAAVQTMQLIVMSGFVCALGQFDSLWPVRIVGKPSFFCFFILFLLPAVWARFCLFGIVIIFTHEPASQYGTVVNIHRVLKRINTRVCVNKYYSQVCIYYVQCENSIFV